MMFNSVRWVWVIALAPWLLVGLAHAQPKDSLYEVRTSPTKAEMGKRATTGLTIASQKGWHVNKEAPITVQLSPSAGVAVDKPKLTKSDVAQQTEDLARFDLGFTATQPGKKTIGAVVKFVVCQETTCKPVTEKVTLHVDVAGKSKK
jgi:hypothetical protein